MKLPAKAEPKGKYSVTEVNIDELEADTSSEVHEIIDGFKARAVNENVRLLDATDSEFWFAVCFQTREMKEEFMRKLDLLKFGDKYLDGLKVAKALGITLESPVPPNRKITKFKRGSIPLIP